MTLAQAVRRVAEFLNTAADVIEAFEPLPQRMTLGQILDGGEFPREVLDGYDGPLETPEAEEMRAAPSRPAMAPPPILLEGSIEERTMLRREG
jgi:hypothetical protein